MERAVVESHGVDQGLQRRARRAAGAHEIDLAGTPEEIVAAQPGHDAARPVVEHHHGDLGTIAERASFLMHQLGQRLLQFVAQRGRHGGAGRLARQPGREMRGLHRQGEPAVGRGAAARHLEEWRIDHAMLDAAFQYAVARRLRHGRRAVRAATLGRLRDGDEESGLGGAKLARLLAEIGQRGGAHALEVAAHWRQRQVDRQHLALRVAPFELQRAGRLDRLGREAARPGIEQAGGLHR